MEYIQCKANKSIRAQIYINCFDVNRHMQNREYICKSAQKKNCGSNSKNRPFHTPESISKCFLL